MATAYITEYARLSGDADGHFLQIPEEPAVAVQTVTYTTATSSAAFNNSTKYIKINLPTGGRILFGTAPTAVAGSTYCIADKDYYFGVIPGQKVSCYDGTS